MQVYVLRCSKQWWSCIVLVSMVDSGTIHIHMWENPRGGGNLVSFLRDGKNSTSTRKTSLISYDTIVDVVGLSWVSQWDRSHDAFHTVVNLCRVLNPRSVRCWESEVAWPTTQEEGVENLWWAYQHIIMGRVLHIWPTKYDRLSKNKL